MQTRFVHRFNSHSHFIGGRRPRAWHLAVLLVAMGAAATGGLQAETVNLSGAAGDNGASGSSPGVSGSSGGTGQGVMVRAVSLLDAVKVLTLAGGTGGAGGTGSGSASGQGGSGGRGARGGNATGTAEVTLDEFLQSAEISATGGGGGNGGGAGAGASLQIGSGGDGGNGGDAEARAILTAGARTGRQTARLTVRGGNSGGGGSGAVLDPLRQSGGNAGNAGNAGEGSGRVVMEGSAATTVQSLTLTILGGVGGRNGEGVGFLNGLQVNPSLEHPVNAVGSFVALTPANNARVDVNVGVQGGGGTSRPNLVNGGPMSSMGRLEASRVAASGTNVQITFNGTVAGGGAMGWNAPSGPGVLVPTAGEGGGGGGGGAGVQVEGIDLEAGPSGDIQGMLTLRGGDGGALIGNPLPRSGRGARIAPKAGILHASSQGGAIVLTLNGVGGAGGDHLAGGPRRNGGSAILVNALEADNTTGSVTLTQAATGGTPGGRAVSTLEHQGTTTGAVSVNTTATGRSPASFTPADLALISSLGSAEATTIVQSVGSSAQARSTAMGGGTGGLLKGADAEAVTVLRGPSNLLAVAVAVGGDGAMDGIARALARAEVTEPGSPAFARALTQRDMGRAESIAVAAAEDLPVRRLTARFLGVGLASVAPSGGEVAAGADMLDASLDGGLTLGAGTVRVNAIDVTDPLQFQTSVTTPLQGAPAVGAFFAGLADEQHAVSARVRLRSAGLDFAGERRPVRTLGGTVELRGGRTGGQLVLGGLGFASQGGGFDAMTFRFRRNGELLLQREFADPTAAAGFFANAVTVLADLVPGDGRSVFTWEIEVRTVSATQGFDADFLLSTTASNGVLAQVLNPPFAPRLVNTRILHPEDLELQPIRFTSEAAGLAPYSTALLESTGELGAGAVWQVVGAASADAEGRLRFDALPLPVDPALDARFFRLRMP